MVVKLVLCVLQQGPANTVGNIIVLSSTDAQQN